MGDTITKEIEMPLARVKEFETLMEEVKLETWADAFSTGLDLLKWAIKARKAGNIVAEYNPKEKIAYELELWVLDAIKID